MPTRLPPIAARRGLAPAAALLLATLALGLPACAGVAAPPAQRSHAQCPLDGSDERTLLIDSPVDWHIAWPIEEVAALGRAVDWPRERVLVHALAQQPTLGVHVEAVALGDAAAADPPRLGLRVTRPAPGAMAATASSRPCVVVALARGPWQALQLFDADRPAQVIATVTVGPLEAGPRKFPHAAPTVTR